MKRQTHPTRPHVPTDHLMALVETESIVQTYVIDEHPGPSAHLFVDGEFISWMPGLTYERAVAHAERM